LMVMTDSGWRGHILVVLCRPFTNTQTTLTFDTKHATFYNLKRTGMGFRNRNGKQVAWNNTLHYFTGIQN
jgi:hypothetical protein